MTTIQYLSLTKFERFLVNFGNFFKGIGRGFVNFFKGIPNKLLRFWHKITSPFDVLAQAWKKGSWGVRTNFLLMGFYQLTHHQIIRGVLYLVFEAVFVFFMITTGVPYLAKLGNLGSFAEKSATYVDSEDIDLGGLSLKVGDNSTTILLYAIVTIILIIIFFALWFFSIRDAKSLQDNILVGRYAKDSQFFHDIVDSKYHTLLLAVPIVGLVGFTVIPVIFMIITSFTNFSDMHYYLFDWVGFENYAGFFSGSSGEGLLQILLKVLAWTLMWALIATFTNYFLGMAVALLINKKGIKLKKLWRTVLILTIAVPQFVSLLLINQMLAGSGVLTNLFREWGWISGSETPFSAKNPLLARILIIVVNTWVGVPYTMLICSGILMNIPEDLYESARIDGATPFKMYTAITLPYMLFITGPYLLSQFIGNINNFNIVYLLSQGGPSYNVGYGSVGKTDLLITWIYKMSMTDEKGYALACALGVIVFIIIAVFSLTFYSRSNSVKNEEDFQ